MRGWGDLLISRDVGRIVQCGEVEIVWDEVAAHEDLHRSRLGEESHLHGPKQKSSLA